MSKRSKRNWRAKVKPFLTHNFHTKSGWKLGKSFEPFLRPGTNKAQAFQPISSQYCYSSLKVDRMEELCLIFTCPPGFHNFVFILLAWLSYKWWVKYGFSFALHFFAFFWQPMWCYLKMNIYFHASRRIYFYSDHFEISCNTILNWHQKPLVFNENTIWSKGGLVEETLKYIYSILTLLYGENYT